MPHDKCMDITALKVKGKLRKGSFIKVKGVAKFF